LKLILTKRKMLEDVARYTLVVLLVLSFLVLVFVSYYNPETYSFGIKLSGVNALIYLLIGGIAGIVIAYLLFKKKSGSEILAILYFGYFLIETVITNLSLGFGFLISPLLTIGLVISVVLLLIRKMA